MSIERDNEERRRFQRVLFDAPTRVTASSKEFVTSLADISLKGALLIRPDDWSADREEEVDLVVLLDDNETRIHMHARVAHVAQDCIGLNCLTIDLESIGYLRRLVELNLGDISLLERELQALG